MQSDSIVLMDGIMPFEVEEICGKLDAAKVRFTVEPHSMDDADVKVVSDNAASRLASIYNAFSSYGLGICYRVLVHCDDYDKAMAALGEMSGDMGEEP